MHIWIPKFGGTDVKEFNPERFSKGIAKATKGSNSYFPFWLGPRICIGQNLALIEAKLALSMILLRFAFELSPSYTHAPTSLIALLRQNGAHHIPSSCNAPKIHNLNKTQLLILSSGNGT